MVRKTAIFTLVLLFAAISSCRKQGAENPHDVAVTNSYLECAVRDLLGSETPALRLGEPGMCPGHFDIRPSQVQQLRGCRVLLRFDFQKSLDARLSSLSEQGLSVAEIRIPGGLCEPDSYLSACRQAADVLVESGLLDRKIADERLEEIARRIDRITAQCRQKVEALKGTPILVSVHQEAFCKWLGLNVVATFSGADTASISQVDRAVRQGEQAGVKLVIANLPEGRRVADALAERLRAKVVVFGNFPALGGVHSSFDDLLTSNVSELVKAIRQ